LSEVQEKNSQSPTRKNSGTVKENSPNHTSVKEKPGSSLSLQK